MTAQARRVESHLSKASRVLRLTADTAETQWHGILKAANGLSQQQYLAATSSHSRWYSDVSQSG
ncbi:hypothetical protein SH467x_003779 [Pirellulaceae bacterium SH467]